MGSYSIVGHRIDYNGSRGSERPAAHTQQNVTEVPPPVIVVVTDTVEFRK